jgi:PAS domain S-box-containing protein
MLATAVWSFGNAMEICSVGLAAKTVWSNIEYAGITAVPVAWLAGTLSLAGKSEWFARRNMLLLLVIPVATQVFVWTNGYHGLMRYNVWLDESGPFAVIVKTYGPWFWIWTAYTYALLAIGTISVTRTLAGLRGPYRAQARLVAVGVLAPWAANILYISGLAPVGRPDITPIALVISGLAGTLAILRYRFLDIQPIAWATVVAGMDDGVVVTDYRGRVVAANPAAQALTGWPAHRAVGKDVTEVLIRWPRAVQALKDPAVSSSESVIEIDGREASYEFRFSALRGSVNSIIGRIIMIRDVTEQRRAHDEIVRQQRAMAAMEEREALARDMHDDICQVLGYLNLELQSARGKLAQGQIDAVQGDIDSLISVVRDAQAEMRSYIRSMMGEAESRRGFVPRLQELLWGVESRYGICTALAISEELSDGIIGHAAKLQLLRIIQEACANTAKHAGASHLWVSVEHFGRVVEVMVRDDGKGFSVVNEAAIPEEDPARASTGGLGLSIMRERAERLGGDFAVRSSLGKGTEVRVCIPVKPDGGGS